MKKTIIALMALAGISTAAEITVLEEDFTKWSGNSTNNTPTGWGVLNLKNSHATLFDYNTNGAINNGDWTVVSLFTDIDIKSDCTYTLTFNTYGKGDETQNVFYLSSDTYSLAIGNSYNNYAWVSVGEYTGALQGIRVSFQPDAAATNPTVLATSPHNNKDEIQLNEGDLLDVHNPLSYTLTLSSGQLDISVKDSHGNTWSDSLEIAENFNFKNLGWAVDGAGGAAGIQNVKVTVPEPTTATLSLLALAGLAVRRRRK